ncbi:hypothetical protein [Tenacibaculum geojense]|uniref:Uncharacterized protein n=1 Tax=Tenacibaculum geojense TaxID=915352 RepID=A0ABW3JT20_9FLAO
MFKESKIIDKINEIVILNDVITYKRESKLIINNKEIDINPLLWFIDELNECIWLKDEMWDNYFIKLKKLSFEKIDINIAINSVKGKYCIGFFDNQLSVVNIKNFTLNFKLSTEIQSFKESFFLSEVLIISTEDIIQCFSILNKQMIWSLDINKLESKEITVVFSSILGILNNSLFISCNKNNSILSVDINTGKIQNKWREIPGININSQIEGIIPNTESFVLDKEQSKLIGAFHKYYLEIDLKSNEISYVDVSEELSKYDIIFIKQSNDISFTKDHLYLTAMIEQYENDTKFTYDCIFLLNRNTLKIDWIYKFKEASLGTHKPKLSGNKLYQLDNNNTLHVFEKVIK